jgi:hypothetical protein
MISSIERGVQDPRHSTLERILAVCDQTIDIAPIAGRGVDPTQFVESLRLTPGERLRSAAAATRNVGRFLKEARRIRKR